MENFDQERRITDLLTSLSIGLLQQQQAISAGKPVSAILLNEPLRRGWEQLTYLCYETGHLPPRSIPELVVWLHQPVGEWPVVGEISRGLGYTKPLLEAGLPSLMCEALGEPLMNAYNPRLELEDECFRRLYKACQEREDSTLYTRLREFIVRNPVVSDFIESISLSDQWDAEIRTLLLDCYEQIPRQCMTSSGMIAICPHCAWTLSWVRGVPTCYSGGSCADRLGNLEQFATTIPFQSAMRRTKEGIQRYVVAPEITLIKLFDRLSQCWGVRCTLYPNLDSYDLLLEYASGQRWAVDVKDWRSPVSLALGLNEQSFSYSPPWDRAFFVFPDYYANSAYMNAFSNYWHPQKDVTIIGAQDFIALALREAGE